LYDVFAFEVSDDGVSDEVVSFEESGILLGFSLFQNDKIFQLDFLPFFRIFANA